MSNARASLATGQSVRTTQSRVAILTQIAERYSELVSPLNGPNRLRGDGDSVIRMPRTYTPTVREFERLASRLRSEKRGLWWHLDGWWLSAETKTMFNCPRCGLTHRPEHLHPNRRSGRATTVKCKRVVVCQRRPGAREQLAKTAIGQLATWWDLPHEPFLPQELRIT